MKFLVSAAAVLAVCTAVPVQAQSLGTVVKKSAEREAKRQAERRTREAVQCVTGARDCVPDKKPETTDASRAKAIPAAPAATGGDGADAYLLPSGNGSAAAAAPGTRTGPYRVAAIPGATAVDSSGPAQGPYRRITGFKPKQLSFEDHSGLLTRTRYELSRGQTAGAIMAAWAGPLKAQGFVTEWECAGRKLCGSSAYHQLGAGYPPVNGINLGIGGDVAYYTGRLVRAGQPTVVVAIAANPKVAYVDVVELAQ